MNTRSHPAVGWVPAVGVQLRKAGVQFDAVRLEGEYGREIADELAAMTGGDPGPVVESGAGRRYVYFLVAPRSTVRHRWPEGVTRLTSGVYRTSFIPVPARKGHTWPLSWRYPPTAPDRFVHTLLLRSVILGEAESGLS